MSTKQRGLTLIELLVGVMILAIVAATAVPSMKSLLGRKNIHAVGKLFDQSVRLARTEAARRTQPVLISPSGNGNDWSEGWFIEALDPDTGKTELIRRFDSLKGNPIFTSNTFTDSNPAIILPNGQASKVGEFSLQYSDCGSSKDKISFQLMLSGLLKKTITPCP